MASFKVSGTEPLIPIQIGAHIYQAMIDMGATVSTLPADALPASKQSQTVVRIERTHNLSQPQVVRIGTFNSKTFVPAG